MALRRESSSKSAKGSSTATVTIDSVSFLSSSPPVYEGKVLSKGGGAPGGGA
jgi:hypothetical protein